jgi:hypothetical protein
MKPTWRGFAMRVPTKYSPVKQADGPRASIHPFVRLAGANVMPSNTSRLFLLSTMLALAGCATRPAPDISGRWKAVNRYAEATQEIPLSRAYVFSASPLDGTLKTMLERWSKDSKKMLSWLHPSDFTLSSPVADVHTSDLQEAISRLNTIYAPQLVSINADNDRIIVQRSDAAASMAAPSVSIDASAAGL